MSRFEAEIGNRTVAGQLVNNPSNPYQQPPLGMTMLHQQLPPQKYLGTTVPGNMFPSCYLLICLLIVTFTIIQHDHKTAD